MIEAPYWSTISAQKRQRWSHLSWRSAVFLPRQYCGQRWITAVSLQGDPTTCDFFCRVSDSRLPTNDFSQFERLRCSEISRCAVHSLMNRFMAWLTRCDSSGPWFLHSITEIPTRPGLSMCSTTFLLTMKGDSKIPIRLQGRGVVDCSLRKR